PFSIPTGSNDAQEYFPDIAALPDGGWVVVWSGEPDGATPGAFVVRYQEYSADGMPAGQPVIVSAPWGLPEFAKVTVLNDGRFVITWTDPDDTIHQRIYTENETPVLANPLADKAVAEDT